MNFLVINFCTNSSVINGTYTVSIKMIKELSRLGHSVFFVKPKNIDLVYWNEISSYVVACPVKWHKCLILGLKIPKKIDVIISFTIKGLLFSSFVKRKFALQAKNISFIYHELEYQINGGVFLRFSKHIGKKIMNLFPKKNLFFGAESMRCEHEKYFGFSFSSSPVISVPCEIPKEFLNKTTQLRKIVSVGRMVSFKRYVFDVVDSLNDIYKFEKVSMPFEYHIYGDGPLRRELQNMIKQYQLEKIVFLHDVVPYSDFKKVLDDAYLFIGHGTSMLEAVGLGVLSLICGAFSKDVGATYGFFHEPLICTMGGGGEYHGNTEYSLRDKIIEALNFSKVEYEKYAYLGYLRSKKFSTENIVQEALHHIENAVLIDGISIGWLTYAFFALDCFSAGRLGMETSK